MQGWPKQMFCVLFCVSFFVWVWFALFCFVVWGRRAATPCTPCSKNKNIYGRVRDKNNWGFIPKRSLIIFWTFFVWRVWPQKTRKNNRNDLCDEFGRRKREKHLKNWKALENTWNCWNEFGRRKREKLEAAHYTNELGRRKRETGLKNERHLKKAWVQRWKIATAGKPKPKASIIYPSWLIVE